MQIIPLQNIPNQVFSITLNEVDYRIALRTIQGFTLISVWQNGDILFYNQLCVPNSFVNPYDYVSQNGKLYFRCLDDEYPNYNLFGNTQQLYFLTPDEVKAYEEA